MATRQKKTSKFSGILFPVSCILVSIYFLHHGFHGRYGVESFNNSEVKITQLKTELVGLRSAKEVLEHRVSLLKAGSIERDMLDEQARYHLNMLHQDDVAIFYQ